MPRVRPTQCDAGQVQLFTTFHDTATREAEEIIPATRKLEPGTARDIMRSYGVTFEALEGEVPLAGDVPAAPVNPAAP